MEEQRSVYLTQEIIRTNQELRKQLAEDDILIADYRSKINSLERDLEHCNREINLLSNTIIRSEDEIESLKKENTTLSKQLRKALLEVEQKEKCLIIRDNQINDLEEKILTLKNRIKYITSRKMTQPTIAELQNAYDYLNSEFNAIRTLAQDNIKNKLHGISIRVDRFYEVSKWYLVAQNQNQVNDQIIRGLTNEKNTAQGLAFNAQRRVNNLQTQLDATNTLVEQKERRIQQENHDCAIERAKHDKWKDSTKTERAKHAKWKTRARNSHVKHGKWKQRFRLLEQQVNQPQNMTTL